MISSVKDALHQLDHMQGRVPVEAIEYLREASSSPEINKAVVEAIDNTYPCEDSNFRSLFYAVVAEKHLSEQMIGPVVRLFVSQEDEWWPMSLQGRYLLDRLMQEFPEKMTPVVINALEKEVEDASMMPYYNLFEAFYFAPLGQYEDRILNLYQDQYLSHAKVLSKILSDSGMQAAIPVMKQWNKRYEKNRARYSTAQDAQMEGTIEDYINRLENEADQLPDTSTAFIHHKPEWKTFLAGVFSKLQEHQKGLMDLSEFWNADEEEEEETSEQDSMHSQPATVRPATQPSGVVDYSKVHRNDPCPCGSGKKFKKCCMNKVA